jgi:hypothetical protein
MGSKRRLVIVGTVLLVGVGVAIAAIVLARGSGNSASSVPPTATNSRGTTHHSNLPINPTGGKTPTPPATTIQIGSNAQITVRRKRFGSRRLTRAARVR